VILGGRAFRIRPGTEVASNTDGARPSAAAPRPAVRTVAAPKPRARPLAPLDEIACDARMSTATPPTDPFTPYPDAGDTRYQSWPFIFGALSLVVAVFGMCMQAFAIAGIFANSAMMGLAGIEASPPPDIVVWTGGVQSIILCLLGILLGVGATMLLLRKPLGAKLVLAWAVARLVMVVVGIGLAVLTIKPQSEWAVTLTSEIRESMRSKGVKEDQLPPLVDEKKAQADAMRNIAIFSIAFSVWPFVMAWVLTRPRSKADVASWAAASPPGAQVLSMPE
jgi:hypothetical protein